MALQALVRLGMMLLMVGGIFLTSASAHASENTNSMSSSVISLLSGVSADVGSQPVVTPSALDPQPASQSSWTEQQDDPSFVLLTSQRRISFIHHELQQCRPIYLLAYEFTCPPAPAFSIGYRVDFTPMLDWRLSANPKPSKISGWKESNLLYRFSQQIS